VDVRKSCSSLERLTAPARLGAAPSTQARATRGQAAAAAACLFSSKAAPTEPLLARQPAHGEAGGVEEIDLEYGAARTRTWNRRFWRPVP
jgi:hypothetical protein